MLPMIFIINYNCNNLNLCMQKEQEPDFQLFKKWFHQNGGLVHKIKFPARFQPLNYIGIAASQDIKANEAFLAIPKKLLITVTKVRQSSLGPILQKYQSLNNPNNQQTQFNVITLYLIWQKMMGASSFFYPYLQAAEKAQTIIQWSDEQILKLNDPYITIQFVNQLRSQFPPVYKQFHHLSYNHPQLFKQPITWQLFMECYSMVMTRCFGWGLPEVIMVPYADFLNHYCNGVHHYILNRKLQQNNGKERFIQQYIKKRKQIDLSLLGINNRAELPISYERNPREKFIYQNRNLLHSLKKKYDPNSRLYSYQTKQYLQTIHKQLLQQNYDIQIYPSTNSQDNDTEEQQDKKKLTKQQIFNKQFRRLITEQTEHKFKEPAPSVNRQFDDDVTFQWWDEMDDADSYFIVASNTFIKKDQQIFNSYGRRSNRFLLVWYGFTHFNNKYDSIIFRFWDEQTYEKTGKMLFVKCFSQKEWIQQLKFQKSSYKDLNVTDEYRLKRDNICYELMAYLRLRIVRRKQIFRGLYTKKLITVHKIHNLQLQRLMLQEYQLVLNELRENYRPQEERQRLNNKYRDYFASLLTKSNQQILMNHYNGVNMLKSAIKKLQKGQILLQVYKGTLTQQQQSINLSQNMQINMLKTIKYQNRKFAIDYFKMLGKYFQRIIKK